MSTRFFKSSVSIITAMSIGLLTVFLAGCGDSAPVKAPLQGTPPVADYGDAPDGAATNYPGGFIQVGTFPSFYVSDGARSLNIDAASLGPNITSESDANVAGGDADDGIVSLFTTLTQIPPPTTMTVNVTAPAGSEGGSYFLNSAIDLNMDGRWGGTGASGELEWVVQNQPVTVVPGVMTPVTSPAFAFTNGLLVPESSWMRVALTKEQVTGTNWDGTGEFSSGEIEDHAISMPLVNGKEVPMLQVDCGGPYEFEDNPTIPVTCTVTNLRTVAGSFTHTVVHQPNGGTVNVDNCLPAGNVAIGSLASKDIVCTATKGTAPDAWTFKATAIDPPSVVKDDGTGIIYGHDATATAQVDFTAKVLTALYLVSMQSYFLHTVPGQYSEIFVSGMINAAMGNALVTMTLLSHNGGTQEITATTDATGAFNQAVKIYSYGLYTLAIQSIFLAGYQYMTILNEVAATQEIDVK